MFFVDGYTIYVNNFNITINCNKVIKWQKILEVNYKKSWLTNSIKISKNE